MTKIIVKNVLENRPKTTPESYLLIPQQLIMYLYWKYSRYA